MPDSFIDLVVTSPPYDGLRKYNGYSFEFEKICHSLFRVIKDGGVCVWVIGDETKNGGESLTSFKQALYFVECCGFKLFDTMIYAKPPRGAVGNNKTYWQSFEYMFVFSKTKPKTLNLIRDRKNKECRDGDSGTKRLTDGSLLKVKRNGYGEYGRRTNIWEYGTGKGQSTKEILSDLYYDDATTPESSIKELCIMGDTYISEQTAKIYKKVQQKGTAYPTTISVNDDITHKSTGVLREGDLVKVYVAAHIEGWTAHASRSFVLGPGGAKDESLPVIRAAQAVGDPSCPGSRQAAPASASST